MRSRRATPVPWGLINEALESKRPRNKLTGSTATKNFVVNGAASPKSGADAKLRHATVARLRK
jgi:hypothetical protein